MITTSNTQLKKTKSSIKNDPALSRSTQRQDAASFILFNIVTDYITITLMLVKLFYGLKYMKSYLFHGTKDEKYIMDKEGDNKWRIRILSGQRKEMQNYYMFSITFLRFTFVQSICLIFIFFDKLLVFLKLMFILWYSIVSYCYLVGKMS